MREAAPERTAIADCRMGDMGDSFPQQRGMGFNFGGFQHIDVTGQRANRKDVTIHRNPAKLSQLADVDNEFGGDQAQIHRRHQALAARQYLGLVAMRGQQFQRISDAGCAGVSESRGFHFETTSPARISTFSFGLDGDNFQRSSLFIE